MENIKSKIKKLLSIAYNTAATEHEAESAMTMATSLMAKYNLQVDLSDEEVKPKSGEIRCTQKALDSWEKLMVSTSATLYQCTSIVYGNGGYRFIGRTHSVEAAEMTYEYLVEQINRLYKASLPTGLSVSDRAEYRRTFKWACAVRVHLRAKALLESLRSNDDKALEYTGSKALVIVQSFDQQLDEARTFMDAEFPDLRPVIQRSKKAGTGTRDGRLAGEQIKLNRELGK